ncbi:MAG: hypothetical protein ACJ74O_00195 [Frankiaceae bacterium]
MTRAGPSQKSPAAGARYEHGKLVYPLALAAKIDRVNGALDACYTSHGAQRIPFDGGGWSYRDPQGKAAASCTVEQSAANRLADSREMAAFGVAVKPLAEAFRNCLNASPAMPKDDDHPVDASAPAYITALDQCSALANSKAAIPAG